MWQLKWLCIFKAVSKRSWDDWWVLRGNFEVVLNYKHRWKVYRASWFLITFKSSRHHHSHKLFVIDVSISIDVCFSDHFVDFLVGELLPQIGHHVPELGSWDEAIAIPVEYFEGLNELLLSVCVLHLPSHQGEKLREIDRPVTISIHLVDHILKLGFSGVLSQRSHNCT